MANQQHNKVPNNAPRGNKPKTAKWLYIVYGVIMLVLLFGMFGSGSGTKKPVDWNKLSLILERHDYESITVINQEVAEIRIKADAIKAYPDLYKDLHTQTITGTEGPAGYYTYNIGNFEHFDKELAIIEAKTGEHISYKIETHTNALRELLVWFGPLLLLLLLFWGMSAYARKQMGGEGGGFGGMFGFLLLISLGYYISINAALGNEKKLKEEYIRSTDERNLNIEARSSNVTLNIVMVCLFIGFLLLTLFSGREAGRIPGIAFYGIWLIKSVVKGYYNKKM